MWGGGGRGRTEGNERDVPAIVTRKILKKRLGYLKLIFRLFYGILMILFLHFVTKPSGKSILFHWHFRI